MCFTRLQYVRPELNKPPGVTVGIVFICIFFFIVFSPAFLSYFFAHTFGRVYRRADTRADALTVLSVFPRSSAPSVPSPLSQISTADITSQLIFRARGSEASNPSWPVPYLPLLFFLVRPPTFLVSRASRTRALHDRARDRGVNGSIAN